jgi:hypothetical protein
MTFSNLRLSTNPALGGFSCFAGTAAGVGTVKLSDPSFPTLSVAFTAVNVGGVVTLIGVSEIITFDGAGLLAIDPLALAGCATGTSITSAAWTGPFVFQDPQL